MDFLWAVKQMYKGKKVIMASNPNQIFYRDKELINSAESQFQNDRPDMNGCNTYWLPIHFDATDWKLFEGPDKTLSNKIQSGSINHREGNFKEFIEIEDIKEFVNNIRESIKKKKYSQHVIDEIISLIETYAGHRFKNKR